jgi:hypothetical protein
MVATRSAPRAALVFKLLLRARYQELRARSPWRSSPQKQGCRSRRSSSLVTSQCVLRSHPQVQGACYRSLPTLGEGCKSRRITSTCGVCSGRRAGSFGRIRIRPFIPPLYPEGVCLAEGMHEHLHQAHATDCPPRGPMSLHCLHLEGRFR